MKKKLKWYVSILMTICLLVVAGCQSIGSVDLNAVLKNTLKVNSYVGSSTFEFKLDLDQEKLSKLDKEDQEILSYISDISLKLDDIKVQDEEHMSMKGQLSFSDLLSIGFGMQLSPELAVIELDGAKQPFVYDLTGQTQTQTFIEEYGFTEEDIVEFGLAEEETIDEQLLADVQLMVEKVSGHIIENLPNPKQMKVAFGEGTVDGKVVDLYHVQTEFDGAELYQLIDQFLSALLEDRKQTEKLVEEIIEIINSNSQILEFVALISSFEDYYDMDTFYEDEYVLEGPISEIVVEEYEELELDLDASEFEEELTDLLLEEEDVIEAKLTLIPEDASVIVDDLMNGIQEIKDELANVATDPELKNEFQSIFSDALKLKVDYYVDTKMQLRKEEFAINFTLSDFLKEEMELSEVNGFSLKVTNELNDVNKTVKADSPNVEKAIQIERLALMESFEIIELFEEDSWIIDLMKKAGMFTQEYWKFDDDEYDPLIIHQGSITAVPLREVIEEFGGEIEFDGDTKTIYVYDIATGKTLELKNGSSEVVVDGEAITWPIPVQIVNGTTYVPARALAEALGAEIYWEDYEEYKILNIVREL